MHNSDKYMHCFEYFTLYIPRKWNIKKYPNIYRRIK
jgi:hypothetical protein